MEFIQDFTAQQMLFALGLVLVGFLLARIASRATSHVLNQRLTPHHLVVLQRFIFYGILLLFVISALRQLGFHLSVLLGAAGIFSVAIGFASQTSASNIISGIFVLGEGTFGVGDIIRVGSTTGEVISIDMLSVKLRTFDNLFVRIPNETIIKSEVTTLSKFPIRRIDLQLGVAYKEDLERVKEVLMKVADNHVLCLEEPEPLMIITGFGDSAVTFQFSFYATRLNFLQVRNEMYINIKKQFDLQGIEIPFPHRTIYTGAVTEPMPVRLVSDPESAQG